MRGSCFAGLGLATCGAFVLGLILPFMLGTSEPDAPAPRHEDLSQKTLDLSRTQAATQAALGTSLEENRHLRKEIAILDAQFRTGFVQSRTVTVEQVERAYPLVAPKLLLSVRHLSGGAVTAQFGARSEVFQVGQTVEFKIGRCECFLVLVESISGRAVFDFGCIEPEETAESDAIRLR